MEPGGGPGRLPRAQPVGQDPALRCRPQVRGPGRVPVRERHPHGRARGPAAAPQPHRQHQHAALPRAGVRHQPAAAAAAAAGAAAAAAAQAAGAVAGPRHQQLQLRPPRHGGRGAGPAPHPGPAPHQAGAVPQPLGAHDPHRAQPSVARRFHNVVRLVESGLRPPDEALLGRGAQAAAHDQEVPQTVRARGFEGREVLGAETQEQHGGQAVQRRPSHEGEPDSPPSRLPRKRKHGTQAGDRTPEERKHGTTRSSFKIST